MKIMDKPEETPVSAQDIKNLDGATFSKRLAAALIVDTFLITMSITLAVPAFPPAQLFFEILNFPLVGLSLWGIPAATIINSLTNGLFWTLIAAAVYGVTRLPKKYEPLLPMPIATDLPTPAIAYQTVDAHTIPISALSPLFAVREAQPSTKKGTQIGEVIRMREESEEDSKLEEDIRLEDDIEMIEGMNSACAELLRNAGIKTIKDLLRMGATEPERQRLAKEVGVTYATLDRWICRGDLIRIRGIGKKYSALLQSIGVNTVADLSTRNPRNLWQALETIYRTTNLVVRIPPLEIVETWVQNAKNCSTIEVWVHSSKEFDNTFDEPKQVNSHVHLHCKSEVEEERETDCQHRFGYLNDRTKGEPIPNECVNCEKVLECMLNQQYQSTIFSPKKDSKQRLRLKHYASCEICCES
jgi:predicted flap endonuclease-1-like 5' DNA nuclease